VREIERRKARPDYEILVFENHYGLSRRHDEYAAEIRAWAAANDVDFVAGDSHDPDVAEKLLVRVARARARHAPVRPQPPRESWWRRSLSRRA
jgi:hypothetical protein